MTLALPTRISVVCSSFNLLGPIGHFSLLGCPNLKFSPPSETSTLNRGKESLFCDTKSLGRMDGVQEVQAQKHNKQKRRIGCEEKKRWLATT